MGFPKKDHQFKRSVAAQEDFWNLVVGPLVPSTVPWCSENLGSDSFSSSVHFVQTHNLSPSSLRAELQVCLIWFLGGGENVFWGILSAVCREWCTLSGMGPGTLICPLVGSGVSLLCRGTDTEMARGRNSAHSTPSVLAVLVECAQNLKKRTALGKSLDRSSRLGRTHRSVWEGFI